MPTLTPQQQTDLTNWLKDTSQELPESLENVLIEHLLEGLKKEKEKENFAKIDPGFKVKYIQHASKSYYLSFSWDMPTSAIGYNVYLHPGKLEIRDKQFEQKAILTFLSRTPATPEKPDGEAVIPFLDVEVKQETKEYIRRLDILTVPAEEMLRFNLVTVLSFIFWWRLHWWGNYSEALKTITKTYLIQVYA